MAVITAKRKKEKQEKKIATDCPRCAGCMVSATMYSDLGEKEALWKCLNCGYAISLMMLVNRRKHEMFKETPSRVARYRKAGDKFDY